MKGIVRQCHDALRLRRGFGPDDGGAPPVQRQDGERTRRQKVLFGAAVMIALVRDIDDDGRLAVIPAMGGDAGAGRIVERAPSAATRSRASDRAVLECAPSGRRRGQNLATAALAADARLARLCSERIDEMPVLDHVGERLARLDFAGEGEEDRPHRVAEPAVGDDHVEDRLRPRRPSPRRRASRTAAAPPRRSPRRVRRSPRLCPARDPRPRQRTRSSPWRNAMASVSPAKPPPAISTSTCYASCSYPSTTIRRA